MLLVALATLVGTVVLYVVVPKGFLPLQDTGVIVAVTEAAQSVSIPRMADAAGRRRRRSCRQDPAVTGVVSFVGAGTINATPNTGRLTIALKPRDGSAIRPRWSSPGCTQRLAGIPGLSVFMQPVQDIQIGTRVSRTQFQYTLVDTDAGRARRLGAADCWPSCSRVAGAARRRLRPAGRAASAPTSVSTATPRCGWA